MECGGKEHHMDDVNWGSFASKQIENSIRDIEHLQDDPSDPDKELERTIRRTEQVAKDVSIISKAVSHEWGGAERSKTCEQSVEV